MKRLALIGSRVRQASRDERGLTIIELVAAIAIFAVVMSGVVAVLGSTLNLTRQDRNRSVAANLAAQQIDSVRSQGVKDFSSIPVGSVTSTQLVDTVSYTVEQDAEWISQNATSGPCDGVSGSKLAYLRVTIYVSWPNMRGVKPVQSQTLLTPPVGTYDPNTGNIGVKVLDRNAAPLVGIPVSIAGPSPDSASTASDGCAFFAYLPAGSYTVSVNAAGYVNGQGVAVPTQPATVTVGTVTSIQFDYDLAASLALTLAGNSGGSIPNNVAISASNTHLLPNGKKAFAGTGTSRTIGSLFPYLEGYQAWAGDCADADPQGVNSGGTAYWPGASRAPAMVTSPGATTSGSVTLHSLLVTVKKSGVVQPGITVLAHHVADAGCGAGEDLTIPLLTNINGQVLAALPYGTWQLQAVGKSPSGSWPSAVLDPRSPATPSAVINIL